MDFGLSCLRIHCDTQTSWMSNYKTVPVHFLTHYLRILLLSSRFCSRGKSLILYIFITLGFFVKISFTPLLFHAGGCLGCSKKRTRSRSYSLFAWSAGFFAKMVWHSKNLQTLSKSSIKLVFFRIFSEFVQFCQKNSSPDQLNELKLTILLLLTPKPSLDTKQ